ncbi:MAG: hypothetical protein HQK49_08715 [Oligoflexia bacterium]|nr:hypothetical protein [Oligoflexia bacterium]
MKDNHLFEALLPIIFTILLSFCAFLSTYLLTHLIIKICHRYDYLAYPRESRWHKKPTALYGGAGFVLVTSLLLFGFLKFAPTSFVSTPISSIISFNKGASPYAGLLFGSFIIFLFGLIDDIYKLKPHYKLLGQLLSVAVATYFGLIVTYFESSPIFSFFITMIWFLGISNAFNLLDNMDGLSSGVAITAAAIIIVHSFFQHNFTVMFVAIIFASSLAGFWPLNKNPAKVFMGDCGSQFIGFFLAGLAIIGTWKDISNLFITLFFPIMILAIPIFDTTYVSIMRKFHGRKITDGGKDHLSHRLVAIGLSEKRAVNILIILGFGIGITTLFVLHNFGQYLSLALFPFIIIAFSVIGIFLSQINVYNVPATVPMPNFLISSSKLLFNKFRNLTKGESFFNFDFFVVYKRRFAEVTGDIILLFMSLFFAYNLRFENSFDTYYTNQFLDIVIIFITVKIAVLFWQGYYRGQWKYVGIADLLNLLKSSLISFFILIAYVTLTYHFENFSRAVLVLDLCFTVMLLGGVRLGIRAFNEYVFQHRHDFTPVVLYGHDKDKLDLLIKRLKMRNERHYKPLAVFCTEENSNNISRSNFQNESFAYNSTTFSSATASAPSSSSSSSSSSSFSLSSTSLPSFSSLPKISNVYRLSKIHNESLQGIDVIRDSTELYNMLNKSGVKNVISLEDVEDSGLLKELTGKGYKIIVENRI